MQKDASTLPADPFGKRQQVVEVLNVVDEGTSVLVDAQVRADFQAETTLEAVAELFVRHGLPQQVRMDRDVRFVSSPSGSDFPSALVRFCECLGVGVRLCDPHHPQQNGFVERYHRTRPGRNVWRWTILAPWARCARSPLPLHSTTTGAVRIKGAVAATAHHGSPSRPYPSCLRCLTWWTPIAGCRSGMVYPWCAAMARCASISASYYVGRALAGQHVALHLSAAKRAWLVVHEHQVINTLPLKGLTGQPLRSEEFVQLMMGQARAERRLRTAQERRARLGGADSP